MNLLHRLRSWFNRRKARNSGHKRFEVMPCTLCKGNGLDPMSTPGNLIAGAQPLETSEEVFSFLWAHRPRSCATCAGLGWLVIVRERVNPGG